MAAHVPEKHEALVQFERMVRMVLIKVQGMLAITRCIGVLAPNLRASSHKLESDGRHTTVLDPAQLDETTEISAPRPILLRLLNLRPLNIRRALKFHEKL